MGSGNESSLIIASVSSIRSTAERKVFLIHFLYIFKLNDTFFPTGVLKKLSLLLFRNIKSCPSNYVISVEEVRPYAFSDQVIKSLYNKLLRMYT